MPRRADTSWHEAFLARIADGMTYQAAAEALSVPPKTLYYHFKIDPAFRARAEAIRAPRYQTDTSWHDRLPAMIAAGLTRDDAAAILGISRWTIWWHSQTYPRLRQAIEKAQQSTGRGRGLWPSDPDRKRIIEETEMPTDHAYQAEQSDVAAIVDEALSGTTDALERYYRATAAQELHAAASKALAAERARTVLALHEESGLSFQAIADMTLIGTRARVQQLIEKARAHSA